MFPVSTLGTQVIVSAPQAVKTAASGDGKPDSYMLRVLSAVDNNVISLDPPVAPGGTLNKGQYADVPLTDKDLVVNGTGPILVAQYMLSANQVDPVNAGTAQSRATPAVGRGSRRRSTAPSTPSWPPRATRRTSSTSWPPPARSSSSTAPTSPSTAAPSGARGSRCCARRLAGGPHAATSDQPFGIVVYGYGRYTSYMYPGGLNLNKL